MRQVIVGIGQDVVHVPRIERILARWDRRFLDRCFLSGEQAYCLRKTRPAPHLAARFAAKEAFYKALSRGRYVGLSFHDVEVVREGRGAPTLALSPRAQAAARDDGLRHVHLTLTHDGDYALALVVLEA